MVMTSWRMNPSGMSKSSAIAGRAGVTMVEEKGLMKVNIDTGTLSASQYVKGGPLFKDTPSIVTTHLRDCVQFKGFAGSFGPSQVICSTRQQSVQMHIDVH